jgi:3'-phosphoadenosine 5'-phosphosulfate sulfotransferase (PAPS reductase)/FAD synthetase
MRAVLELGIKRVVRGQRIEEAQKSPIRNGFVDPGTGIEYLMPIEAWSTAQVFAYLNKHGIEIPEYYGGEHTSRDCWSCTAFLWNGGIERIRQLPDDKRAIVMGRLRAIRDAVASEAAHIDRSLEAA